MSNDRRLKPNPDLINTLHKKMVDRGPESLTQQELYLLVRHQQAAMLQMQDELNEIINKVTVNPLDHIMNSSYVASHRIN
jgi:hypothetical protein